MAADVTISGGVGPAPQLYEVPNAQEIIPKSVRATFNGTLAGSAFFPTVRIVSDGGVIVAEVATDTSVAAGASASVTFAPFLRGVPASSGGGLSWEGARYTGGVTTIAQNVTDVFPFSLSFGTALLDLSVPSTPTFLTGGVYIVSQVARCVIALGGAQAAGSTFNGNILISSSTGGMGQNVSQRFIWPSGGTFVPQVTVNSVPIQVNAGDALTCGATNSDSAAGNHVYDSPSIWIVKLS